MADVSSLVRDSRGIIVGICTEKPFAVPAVAIRGWEISETPITDGTAFSSYFSTDVGDSAKAANVRLAAAVAGLANLPITEYSPLGHLDHPEAAAADATHKLVK